MKPRILFSFVVLLFPLTLTAQNRFSVAGILNEGRTGSERDMLTIHQDPRIDTLVNRHILSNAKGVEGYRILIYRVGGKEGRDKATKVQQGFMDQFPDVPSTLTFDPPSWFKVKVGNYRSREEAAPDFFKILIRYPDAFLVKDVIEIKSVR
jgi:hypothetical protein